MTSAVCNIPNPVSKWPHSGADINFLLLNILLNIVIFKTLFSRADYVAYGSTLSWEGFISDKTY